MTWFTDLIYNFHTSFKLFKRRFFDVFTPVFEYSSFLLVLLSEPIFVFCVILLLVCTNPTSSLLCPEILLPQSAHTMGFLTPRQALDVSAYSRELARRLHHSSEIQFLIRNHDSTYYKFQISKSNQHVGIIWDNFLRDTLILNQKLAFISTNNVNHGRVIKSSFHYKEVHLWPPSYLANLDSPNKLSYDYVVNYDNEKSFASFKPQRENWKGVRKAGVIVADPLKYIIMNLETQAIFTRLELLQYLSRGLDSNGYFLWNGGLQDEAVEGLRVYQNIVQTLSLPDSLSNLPSFIIHEEVNREVIRNAEQEFLFLEKR